MNIFANYLTRKTFPHAQPLSFFLNQLNDDFDILAREGVFFSHGDKLKFIRERRMNLHPLKLANRKTVFFVRDPLLVSVSMYHHRKLQEIIPLVDFLRSDEGIDNFLWYVSEVVEQVNSNPLFKIFYYEDLHNSNPEAVRYVTDMMRWVFNEVDDAAVGWAYDVCLPQGLKTRAAAQTERVREAKATLDDDTLRPVRDELNKKISTLPSEFARTVLSRYIA